LILKGSAKRDFVLAGAVCGAVCKGVCVCVCVCVYA